MTKRSARFESLTPILHVGDFAASMRYYTGVLGFAKAWEWGDPPDFGCVSRDEVEIFLTSGPQGHSAVWMAVFVDDVDSLYDEVRERGAKIVMPPTDEPWNVREFHVEDPDGHMIRFGQVKLSAESLKITRTVIEARLEQRLAAVLSDLAKETNRSIGEVLEETLLHTFEPVSGQEGQAVASPHTKATLRLIGDLKTKHGLDYGTHANYGFCEE